MVVHRSRWIASPFYGIFFGYAAYALFNYWLGKFHPLTLVVVPPIYAVYFLLTFPALKLADALFPRHGYLLQAALWVCYEYFLKTSGFLAYSYGNMGYSQYPFLPFIQISDITGVWGVSLLVVFPSALLGNAFADGLPALRENWRRFAWSGCRRTPWSLRPSLSTDLPPRSTLRGDGSGRWRWSSRTWIPGRAGTRPIARRWTSWNGRASWQAGKIPRSSSGRRLHSCRPSTGTPATGLTRRSTTW